MAGSSLWPFISRYYPLRNPSKEILDNVCPSLWDWANCALCGNWGDSVQCSCSWSLRACLEPYLQFYLGLTSLYTSEDWDEPILALTSHADLHKVIQLIKNRIDRPKSELVVGYFDNHSSGTKLTGASKSQAFDLALGALTMVPFSNRNRYHQQYPILAPEVWPDNRSAQFVMQNAIKAERPLSRDEVCLVTRKLSAAKLEKYGITILGSNDLRQHLLYDSTARRLYVFQHAGFLRAHLAARSGQSSMIPSLLNRQLALDTLYTLRFVLYAWDDIPSCAMAAKHGVDLSCLNFDMWNYSDDDNDDVDRQYQYWGARLMILAHVVDGPKADGMMRAWIKRRTGKEYFMIVTVLGVIVTIVGAIVGPWMQRLQQNETHIMPSGQTGNSSGNV